MHQCSVTPNKPPLREQLCPRALHKLNAKTLLSRLSTSSTLYALTSHQPNLPYPSQKIPLHEVVLNTQVAVNNTATNTITPSTTQHTTSHTLLNIYLPTKKTLSTSKTALHNLTQTKQQQHNSLQQLQHNSQLINLTSITRNTTLMQPTSDVKHFKHTSEHTIILLIKCHEIQLKSQ